MKKPSGLRLDESGQSPVDLGVIERLAQIAARFDLSEVEVDFGELHVRVARLNASAGPAPVAGGLPQSAPVAAADASADKAVDELAGAVKSPMVGTAYLRPSPEAKPFVEVGTLVKAGDKLLLVEAMKTFNEIVAPRAGKIVAILVSEGSPVEYDQPLIVIE